MSLCLHVETPMNKHPPASRSPSPPPFLLPLAQGPNNATDASAPARLPRTGEPQMAHLAVWLGSDPREPRGDIRTSSATSGSLRGLRAVRSGSRFSPNGCASRRCWGAKAGRKAWGAAQWALRAGKEDEEKQLSVPELGSLSFRWGLDGRVEPNLLLFDKLQALHSFSS